MAPIKVVPYTPLFCIQPNSWSPPSWGSYSYKNNDSRYGIIVKCCFFRGYSKQNIERGKQILAISAKYGTVSLSGNRRVEIVKVCVKSMLPLWGNTDTPPTIITIKKHLLTTKTSFVFWGCEVFETRPVLLAEVVWAIFDRDESSSLGRYFVHTSSYCGES